MSQFKINKEETLKLTNEQTDKSYVDVLNRVYNSYIGCDYLEYYNSFAKPQRISIQDTRKPLAWFQTPYDAPGLYLESPFDDYSGFIPDRVNSCIFDRSLSIEEKDFRLTVLFGILVNIMSRHASSGKIVC